jgi:hypothetical protein
MVAEELAQAHLVVVAPVVLSGVAPIVVLGPEIRRFACCER